MTLPLPLRLLGAALLLGAASAFAQAPAAPLKPVVVSGVVPDEASRAAILARARELYGPERVVDQLGVAKLAAPPNWTQQVVKLMQPELKQVSQGEFTVRGSVVELNGRVDSAALVASIPASLQGQLANPSYQLRAGLRVDSPGQAQLDAALANRIVEFEPARDQLTATGTQVLDQLLPLLKQFGGRRFEVVGHTDSDGTREANMVLSKARAEAVKRYLVERGIPATSVVTEGAGPDRPVADNGSPAGKARNRRIEFRVLA